MYLKNDYKKSHKSNMGSSDGKKKQNKSSKNQ